uniref:3'(2'),5'-bisphosphate nucleotidase n=2 Tax=Rhodosorus marinus TaxID=101924 RepID=A0A7S3AAL3_9RHOD|mmetsp:Transcript_9436/g.40868  ORF Transcript_9436/g.40868 Transcript_9436/m.40868 type:complete len:242 (+) Transcript_9436:144-869(+)
MSYEDFLQRAISVVRVASSMSKTVQKRFRQETGTLSKMDTSPVTVADFAVQALILSELDDGTFKFIAEETSAQLKENSELLKDVTDTVNSALPGRPALSENQICGAIDLGSYAGGDSLLTWVLDPVDGTKGFMRMEQYCIALGLLDRGKVIERLYHPTQAYGRLSQLLSIRLFSEFSVARTFPSMLTRLDAYSTLKAAAEHFACRWTGRIHQDRSRCRLGRTSLLAGELPPRWRLLQMPEP